MLDLTLTPDEYLEPIAEVVSAAVEQGETLRPDDVMVVGAWRRDIQHASLGHRFPTAATRDLDLALALASWHAYERIATALPRIGDNGIRFRIANVAVDLLPFGEIEDPQGTKLRLVTRSCSRTTRIWPLRLHTYSALTWPRQSAPRGLPSYLKGGPVRST